MKETIKNFYGVICGTVETDGAGNKVAKDFGGRILGRYDASQNVTKDFYGRIIAKGDCVVGLIPMNK